MSFSCHFFKFFTLTFPIVFTVIKIAVFTSITPAPAGRLNIKEKISPKINAVNDIKAEIITSILKPCAKLFALTAGRIITPEIKSVPIILIPVTTVRAVKNEIID